MFLNCVRYQELHSNKSVLDGSSNFAVTPRSSGLPPTRDSQKRGTPINPTSKPMCGIAGKIFFNRERSVDPAQLDAMLAVMRHRGPDGQGHYFDGPVGLGHVRLSIIDLSTGAQPMPNEDRTVWITFNGEIYNYQELRSQLLAKGHQFSTNSDTEVIIHLYEEYGSDCVQYLRGMFTFAVWNARTNKLLIARDRVGIKPLYYFVTGDSLAFASEIKSLLTLPEAPRELNDDAVDAFWCFNYLPGELTMYCGIYKLLPGYWMEITGDGRTTKHQYWDLAFRTSSEDTRSLEEAADELSSLLRDTIQQHMISDVPVGFLLSGGMDSSAVLSYAANETTKAISTFTVGFDGESGVVDERPYARLMAQKYGSSHFEATISSKQFWDYLPRLFWHLDEPVCEPPAVALHYISEVARPHVKVLLSGEGGDEAFGGYPNYPTQLMLHRLRQACGPLRNAAGHGAAILGKMMSKPRWGDYGRLLPLDLADYYWSRVGSPFLREASASGIRYTDEFSERVRDNRQAVVIHSLFSKVAGQERLNQMLYLDTKTWLPDDLLTKADKVTMGSSLELRVPLLDHKVLEFAASLPTRFKVSGYDTKRVLKTAFSRVIPQEIINRKKVGFPVPYGRWLAGDLWFVTRDLLLDSESFVSRFFQRSSIERALDHHRQTTSRQREVFSLLALEFWHQQFGDTAPTGGSIETQHSPAITRLT
jgi:asparagine synthase (glutamine-hydrolysing)